MTLSVKICLLALFCGVCQATPPFTSGGSSGGGILGGILGSILGSGGSSSGGGAGASDVVNSLLKVKLGVIDLARERVNSRLDQFSGQSESTATAEAGAVVDGLGGGVPAYEGGNNQQYQGNSQQSQGNSQQNQGYQGNNQQYQGNQQQQHQQQPFRPSYPSNQGGDSYTNAAAAGYSSGDSAGVAYDHNAQQIAGSEYSGQGQNYPSNGGRDYQSGGHSNAASLSNSGSFGSNDNYDNSGSGNNDGISSNSFGSSDSFGSTDNFESNSLSADTKSGSESGSSSNTGSSAGIGGIAELVRSGVNAYRTRINGAFDRASSGLSLINSLGSLLPSLLSSLGSSSRTEAFSVGNRGSDDASSLSF